MKSSDKLISLAKVRGSLDLRCQLQGDWALEQAQESLGVAPYHIVLAGECLMELADGPRLTLRAGEILHLPSGAAHVIRSLGEPVAPVIYPLVTEGAFRVMRIGGASPDLDMLCGNFHYNRASMPFAALPPVSGASRWCIADNGPLPALVAILRREADSAQPGARFLLDSLSQAMSTLILRAHLATQGPVSGTLALLADKRLARAWKAMTGDPAHEWTIESLAEAASMSRATFMRAFVRAAGVSPWVMLTQVRMELAFSLLSRSGLGLSDIAVQVGYQSQAAFSKKFKEVYGDAPGRVRKSM